MKLSNFTFHQNAHATVNKTLWTVGYGSRMQGEGGGGVMKSNEMCGQYFSDL